MCFGSLIFESCYCKFIFKLKQPSLPFAPFIYKQKIPNMSGPSILNNVFIFLKLDDLTPPKHSNETERIERM